LQGEKSNKNGISAILLLMYVLTQHWGTQENTGTSYLFQHEISTASYIFPFMLVLADLSLSLMYFVC